MSDTSLSILVFRPETSSAILPFRSLTALFKSSVNLFVRRVSRSVRDFFRPLISELIPAICSTMPLYCAKVANVAVAQSLVPLISLSTYSLRSEIFFSSSASFAFRSEIVLFTAVSLPSISVFADSRLARISPLAVFIAAMSSSLFFLSLA